MEITNLLGKEIKTGKPVFLRNLLLFPLTNGNDQIENVTGIDDLLGRRLCQILELDPPVIDRVNVNNTSDQRLLVIDGEEILGAMQNRIAASSCFIETKSRLQVPTICVEQGRWEADRPDSSFFSGHSVSYPFLRAALARSSVKPAGPGARRGPEDRQDVVWDEIERKLSTTKVSSFTSSMHDIYEKLNDDISRYLHDCVSGREDARSIDEACGLVACASTHCLALDLFGSVTLFKMFKEKLLRSYALDAIEYRNEPTPIPRQLPGRIFADLNRAEKKKSKPEGLGIKYLMPGKTYLGQALVCIDRGGQEQLLHLSAFPNRKPTHEIE